jgi:quinoprotein glucose dehydrogenase
MLGGGEWTGAAFDPDSGRLYISSNELPWSVTIAQDDDAPPLKPATPGEVIYQQICAGCHSPELRGIGVAPPLRGLRHRLSDAEVVALWKTGRGAMPPIPLAEAQKKPLLDFLMARDRPPLPADPHAPVHYIFANYHNVVDNEGYPGIKPPWGTLNCLDLNSGKILWRVPMGEYPALAAAGGPKTGTPSFAGAMVTAGGLVFCAGTADSKIRAFDSRSGAELWSAALPYVGTAPPASYQVGGRQFIVVTATGGGKLYGHGLAENGVTGDAYVAFALEEKQ